MRTVSPWTPSQTPHLAKFLASELKHSVETAIGAHLFAGREFAANAEKWIALELVRRYGDSTQRFPSPDPHQM